MAEPLSATPDVSPQAPEPVAPPVSDSPQADTAPASAEFDLNDIWNDDKSIPGTSPPQEAATPAAQTETEGEPQAAELPGTDPDAVFKQLAEETGIDLNDPVQSKALRDLAATPKFREFLDKKLGAKPAAEGQPQTPDADLTDIEREILAEQQRAAAPVVETPPGQTPAADGQQQQPSGPQPMFQGDVGTGWTKEEDAYQALNEAWQADDLAKVAAIENSKFVRQFHGMALPVVSRMAEQIATRMVEQRLAAMGLNEVVPTVQRQIQAEREDQARSAAVEQLEKLDGFKDVRKLFEADDPAKPTIKINGRDYPNSPMNRIAQENPDISRIQLNHSDPLKARTATLAARFRQVARIHGTSQKVREAIPRQTAQKLVEAGAEIRNKQEADRIRQAVNSGNGATVRPTKGRGESYVRDALQSSGGMELADLFK